VLVLSSLKDFVNSRQGKLMVIPFNSPATRASLSHPTSIRARADLETDP